MLLRGTWRSSAISFTLLSSLILGSAISARTAHDVTIALSLPLKEGLQETTQGQEDLARGKTLLKRGQADQALPLLDQALKLFTASNNTRGIAAAHNELGDLYLRQGQYTVALQHYRSAFESFRTARSKENIIAASTGIPDNEFNANLMLAKIGDVNYRLGKIGEAGAAYSEMEVKKPESTSSRVGKRFGGLPGILSSAESGRISVDRSVSASGLASEARKEVDQYRASIIYSAHELGTGRVDYANHSYDNAKTHFENALAASDAKVPIVGKLGQMRRFRTAARTSLGDIALRQDRFKDAIKFYTDAVKGAQTDQRLDLQWPAQRGIARSLWLQATHEKDNGRVAKLREGSISAYRDALKTIENIRAGSLRADEARSTFLSTTKDVYDEAASALAEMALASAGSQSSPSVANALEGKSRDYAAEALNISEEGRARSLLDLLSETNAEITGGVPQDLLNRKQENLTRQQEIADQQTGVTANPDETRKKPAEADAQLDRLQTEYDEIENQIRQSSAKYGSLTSGAPVTLAEIQQNVLDDKTVLLEYSLGDSQSYLWLVTPSTISLSKLPSRSIIEQQATAVRAQLIPSRLQRRIVGIDVANEKQRGLGTGVAPLSEGAAEFSATSNALYKTVVSPVASMLGNKRLLVVADGALSYVPFEALVADTGAKDYADLEYLVKTHEVAYAPSASVINAVRRQSSKSAGGAVLVVADPVFSKDDPRARGVSRDAGTAGEASGTRGLGLASSLADVTDTPSTGEPAGGFHLLRLSGTRTEAEQISKTAKGSGKQADTWLDLDASEVNVQTRDLKKYEIIHIATHGLLDAERPQFSGIVLSLVGNKTGDGFLRTDEIFNLNLAARLVMLSACETGLGKQKRGEGVIGMTRAFLYAGAPTVGVSLWSVADRSTSDLMGNFYKELLSKNGVSPSAAMRAAQQAMIAGKRYSAPFYWAPFVMVGDWR